jgi:hypothetical protein
MLRLSYTPFKFRDQVRRELVAMMRQNMAQPTERLTGRIADNASKVSRLWVKISNIITPQ